MGSGKKKIEIKKKEKAEDRMVTFSKRKKGLFQKISQLNALSGAEIAILLFSPTGRPHINSPLFNVALSRYLSSVGGGGATTAAADDNGGSGGSKNDSSLGMWLSSVEELPLGLVDEGGAGTTDHASGSAKGSVSDDTIGTWLSSVESLLVGEAGASTNDCSMKDNYPCIIREWLNSVDVEGIEKLEDLLLMKQRLETIKEKVIKKVEDEISSSYLI